LPTTIEFADLKLPEYVKGIKQDTLQGTSLLYSVTDAKSPSRHTDQYYYIFGSRAIYKDGWKAETAHHPDYIDINDSSAGKGPIVRNFDNDVWELYNLDNDFNERIDLAKKNPEKLKELQALFDLQAKKFNIYPFIDWDDVFKLRIHNNKNNNTASK
jgi:arylsulfatase A-like enzyme